MPDRPRCLDLYCGGFGAGWGYVRAGYDVVGVDNVRRRQRPPGVTLIEADALEVLADHAFVRSFDLVHASPPCKVHTALSHLVRAGGREPIHGDLLTPTRDALNEAGVPWIIENVEGAPMTPHVMLCGSMFGLQVDIDGESWWLKRHRLFEFGFWGNHGLGMQPPDIHPKRARPLGVYGQEQGQTMPPSAPGRLGAQVANIDQARALMDIPWMSWRAITQAIPPAYTEYLGREFAEQRKAA